jgi:hypothetical protein
MRREKLTPIFFEVTQKSVDGQFFWGTLGDALKPLVGLTKN